MNILIDKILESRNLSIFEYDKLNSHLIDNQLCDLDKMCTYLNTAYQRGEQVTILPDFDMDGVSSGAIAFAGFLELGIKANLFVPDTREGYGFTGDTVLMLLRRYPNTKYLFTCDTGITCYEGLEVAKAMGLTVLLSDHHLQQSDQLCSDVIVNPNGLNSKCQFRDFCGAMVVYQILEYYCTVYRPDKLELIEYLQILAGIGTISDLMQLFYDNRLIVSKMTELMNRLANGQLEFLKKAENVYYKCLFRNLSYFLQTQGVSFYDEEYIGYYFAPMINSAKRLDKDIRHAFVFLFAPDIEDSQKSLHELQEMNKERKKQVKEFFEYLDEYSENVYFSKAHKGILGLLAQKKMGNTGYPTIVLQENTDGSYSGSARSPIYYPFNTLLQEAGISCQGHEHSFGIYVNNKPMLIVLQNKIDDTFYSYYEEYLAKIKDVLPYDVLIDYQDLNSLKTDLFSYFTDISFLKPFGKGFPAPTFAFDCDLKDANVIIMGKDQNHLKLQFDFFEGIVFFYDKYAPNFVLEQFKTEQGTYSGRIRLIGQLKLNEYFDTKHVNLIAEKIELL